MAVTRGIGSFFFLSFCNAIIAVAVILMVTHGGKVDLARRCKFLLSCIYRAKT